MRDEGDVLIRSLAVPWSGHDGFIVRPALDRATAEERVDEIIASTDGDSRRFVWVLGPSCQPANLGEMLVARGFRSVITWNGMVTETLHEPPGNPEVVIEELSSHNADDYARLNAESSSGPLYEERLAAALRYLAPPRKEVQIYLGRLRGQAAGIVVLRVEPNGVAYLRNAFTLPEFRHQGVYSALVSHRMEVARAAGCTAAAVQAIQTTSSPILARRGFRTVSTLHAYTRP